MTVYCIVIDFVEQGGHGYYHDHMSVFCRGGIACVPSPVLLLRYGHVCAKYLLGDGNRSCNIYCNLLVWAIAMRGKYESLSFSPFLFTGLGRPMFKLS